VTARYAATRGEVAELVEREGQPRYRVDQVWDALYRRRIPLEDDTSLPKALREGLGEELPLALSEVTERRGDRGFTVKWLWAAAGGAQIETVLMRYPDRATVCVSSQAGCAMGCTFCATGQAGFERHLDTGEMLEQVLRAQHATEQRVSNVVFMGMGEPLANYEPTWATVERLHTDLGLSARHITVSTVGIVPGMRRMVEESLPVTLAVSLHAGTDALRDEIVPINRRYPLREVIDAAAAYGRSRGRRVSFEYALIEGVNDTREQADALARLLRPLGALGAHVNVIPLNPTAGYAGHAPGRQAVEAFATALRDLGVNATVRRNRGTDIDAACGQLRFREATAGTDGPSATMAP
jgi:23S rRNA (adenine2503-C2)-methyltransferase